MFRLGFFPQSGHAKSINYHDWDLPTTTLLHRREKIIWIWQILGSNPGHLGSGLSGIYGTRNPGNRSYLISSSSALWPGKPSFILDCATTTNVVSCCCRSMEMTSSSLASYLSDDDDVGSGTTTVWIWKQSTKMWLKTGA